MKLQSKPFRIAVQGATTDGRVIERDWLEQMAANYNPEKYTARINCEHLRGMRPNGDFKAFGSVVALTTETVQIDGEDKLALLASIEPTADLVTLNRKGQKLFTSMEVNTDFADSNEAYLVGLAVTDSPASLGTEMLQFAAGAELNPLAARKQHPDNLFSAANEVALEFTEQPNSEDNGPSLLERVQGMFSNKKKDDDNTRKDMTQAIETIAGEVVELSKKLGNNGQAEEITELKGQLETLNGEYKKTVTELAELKTQLSETDGSFHQRPPASGGKGAELSDC